MVEDITKSNAMATSGAVDHDPTRPAAPGWLVAIVVVASMALGVLAARTIRSHGVTVALGRLEAERVHLSAEFRGEVADTRVVIGQEIEPGDVVAVLRQRPTGSRTELQERAEQIERERDAALARFDFEVGRLTSHLDSEIHALEMQVATLKGDLYSAEMERVAWRDALEGNDVSTAGYDASLLDTNRVVHVFGQEQSRLFGLDERGRFQAVLAHERAAASADSCKERINLCDARLNALKTERTRISDQFKKTVGLQDVEARLASAQRAVAAYEQPTELVSPAYGMVVSVATKGDVCDVGVAVVELADDARRRVTAEVAASDASTLNRGDEVTIVFSTGDKRTGTVGFVSPSSQDGETVQVVIEPAGKRWPDLALGSTVAVEFE